MVVVRILPRLVEGNEGRSDRGDPCVRAQTIHGRGDRFRWRPASDPSTDLLIAECPK